MSRVLVVEPDAALRADVVRAVAAAGFEVDAEARTERIASRLADASFDVAVVDLPDREHLATLRELRRSAPGLAIVATGATASLELAVEAIKLGARDFLRKPFAFPALEAALTAAAGPAPGRGGRAGSPLLLTEDPAMQALLRQAEAAARTDATVQILGESGTGKDLLAHFIHECSRRREGPYVRVDCASLHDALTESELFGHEAGAFTGAHRSRLGQVRVADGGTLVLDHVSEASEALQPKLLRVLQEREVLPLGAERPVGFDARMIATAQHDLGEQVARGRFRADLYFRLDVVSLRIPPLRERRSDVRLLARHFVEQLALRHDCAPPQLGEAALARLERHPFRGNVRELENLMRRAVVLFPGQAIDAETLLQRRRKAASPPAAEDGEILNLKELERRAIVRSLEQSRGNRTAASRALGISVRTLRNKIRLYQLA